MMKAQMQTSNAILNRNKVVGHSVALSKSGTSYVENEITNPFTPITPWNLIRLMFLLHERKGLRPKRTQRSYIRQARKFLATVDESRAERLMLEAARVAKHPWGFSFLEKLNAKY